MPNVKKIEAAWEEFKEKVMAEDNGNNHSFPGAAALIESRNHPQSELQDMLWKAMAAAMDHLLGYVGSAQLNVQCGRLTGTATWYGGQITVKVERI